jgi:hypothetical protein
MTTCASAWALLVLIGAAVVAGSPIKYEDRILEERVDERGLSWGERGKGDFDVNYTVSVAQVAFAAYCHESALKAWNCHQCKAVPYIKYVAILDDLITSTYGFVAVDLKAQTVFVSFRGSINIPNWITNFEFLKVRDWVDAPDSKVHSGFYHAYLKVRVQLRNVLRDTVFKTLCPACKRVVVTGHSLGAALAGICAMDLRVEFGSGLYIEMVDFGMPRVGNAAFARDFPRFVNYTRRVVHQNDIVPHLPPREIGFVHVAPEVWSRGEGATDKLKFDVCSATNGEDPTCSDSVPVQDYSVNDHMIYMGAVTTRC